MQRYRNYPRPIWIVLRSLSTVALTLGLLGITGCGWLFSQPESPLSEQEAEAILSTQREAARLYNQLVSEGNPDAAVLVAEWLRNAPEVAEVVVDEDNTIHILYKCGLSGMILSYEYMVELPKGLQPLETRTQQPNWEQHCAPCSYGPSSVTSLNSRGCEKKAVIFAFNEEFYKIAENTNLGEEIKKSLDSMGYCVEVCCGSDFTVERLEHLDQYSVIIFHTHGKASPFGHIVLATGEPASILRLRYYWAWLKKGIGVITTPDGKDFIGFDENLILSRNLRFPNSLVLALACETFKLESMADAFLQKGAALYFGWTDETTNLFELWFLYYFFTYGKPWPCGWSVSDVMNAKFQWHIGMQKEASLQEVFGNPESPPKIVSCSLFIGFPRKVVEISLPAIGYVESHAALTCFVQHEATPLLKWKGASDLVLNPSEGDVCKGFLEISFTPTSVPFEIRPAEGLGWFYTVTISEKKGSKVKLSRLQIERYDANGNLLAKSEWDERGFFRLFKTNELDANVSISTRWLDWPRPYDSHTLVVWKVFGTNLDKDRLEVSGKVQLQQNATRGLKVDISPPILVEDKWVYEVSISELRGLKTNLMGMLIATFDELGLSLNLYTGNFDQLFGTHVIPGNGQIKTFLAQPYDPADRSLAWVVAGVDEKGTVVYGSGVAELTGTSNEASEKAYHPDVKVIVPLAHSVEGVE
jgi:hypothetical protein